MTGTNTLAVPQHIGLILDGNRRWAREHNLPLMEGHRQGYENLKDIAQAAFDKGVKYVSAFVFSTENWNRSKDEVKYLMLLLKWVLKEEVKVIHSRGIRLRVLGAKAHLSKTILKLIHEAEELTRANTYGTLLVCLNYGGQQEITDAVKQIIEAGYKSASITPQLVSKYIYAPDAPSVDLIIRTSGEQRLSGFMLWRSTYSELLFTNKYWPAFTKEDLIEAIEVYTKRQRRFGG